MVYNSSSTFEEASRKQREEEARMEAQSAVSAPLREWMTRRGLEEFIGAAGRVRLLEVLT